MPRNSRDIGYGTLSVSDPPEILGSYKDGCKGSRLLRVSVSGIQVLDAGLSAIHHHLQHGGGCGGVTLG